MEEAIQKASPDKSPAIDAESARTAFMPAPPESAPAGLQEHPGAITDREGKYLTFSLAGEEYGIGILKIKEIIGMMPITAVPQTPKFVKGVINLRGKVIPVVDLRLRFVMDAIDYNDRTCIIVVEIGGRGTDVVIGIVVDSVSEVLNIKNEDIEDTPTFGTTLNTDYILGMAKMEGKVKILLDIDKVLSQEDLQMLKRTN
jgi:purine-binding chemotaxis protein CheW